MSTLVLTDLVDSTKLIQTLGDVRAAEVFRRVDRLARDLVALHDGLEIDRTDGQLVLFDLPLAGVEYAVTLHQRLAELKTEFGVALFCRAAIHVGEVILRANAPEDVARGAKRLEVEGIAKPATARLLSLALPGQTLLGRTAYELARRAAVGRPGFERYVWASHGEYRFKGLEEPFAVHEVGLAGQAPLHTPPDSDKARRSDSPAPVSAPVRLPRGVWLWVIPVVVASTLLGIFLAREPPPRPAVPYAEFVVNPPGTWATSACIGSPLAISHDGRTVAFSAVDESDQGLGLVVRPLDALEVRPTRLGPSPFGSETNGYPAAASRDPFFSPDDRWLGFFQGPRMGRVLMAGGSPEGIASRVSELRLDASGSAKGAAWTSTGIVAAPNVASGLLRFPPDDGPPVAFTTLDTVRGDTSHRWPDLLPDGRHLLVTIKSKTMTTFDEADIGIVGIDGGVPQVLLSGGYYARYSPSGHIVFARRGALMAAPFDETRNVVIGPAVTVLEDVTTDPGSGVAAFAIARNGTLLYVPGGSCEPESKVVWTSPDGSQEVIDLPRAYYHNPLLSPDGTRAAVVAFDAYDTAYVVDLKRQTRTRITSGFNAHAGSWDSDGEHVFVVMMDAEGNAIARVRADGTGEPEILHRAPASFGIGVDQLVSVDGHDALLGVYEGKGIVLFSIDGEPTVTPVADVPFTDIRPRVSPDGRCLAYASVESGRMEIYVRPFPSGSGRSQVSSTGGAAPIWSHDGRLLLYVPPDAVFDASKRVAVSTVPGDCLTIAKGPPTPMPAPPGERLLEARYVKRPSLNLDLIAIQGWSDTLKSAAP